MCCVCSVAQSCPTLCDPMDCSLSVSPVHGDCPGKNTGVGCHFLFQGIFPTQGSNPHLLHWQVDSLPLSQLGSPHKEDKGTNFSTVNAMSTRTPCPPASLEWFLRSIRGDISQAIVLILPQVKLNLQLSHCTSFLVSTR